MASNLQSQTALDRGLAQKFGKYTRRVKHYEPPQKLTGHTDTVGTLAVGLDGRIFSGSHDEHIRVSAVMSAYEHPSHPSLAPVCSPSFAVAAIVR